MYSAWLIVTAILVAWLPSAATASDTSVPLIAPDGFETIHPIFVDKAGDTLDISARILSNGQLLPLQDGRIMAAFNRDQHAAISFSTNAGATWTEPHSLPPLPEPGVKKIGRVSALQTRDGTIWLFHYGWISYTKEPQTSRSDLWARKSTNGGKHLGATSDYLARLYWHDPGRY